MAHIHDVTDQDTHFLVDTETRKISNETNTKVTLVQFDHNSEVLTFEMPRMVEGHDMAECDEIRVHYINISKNRKKQKEGVYEVQDKGLSEDEQNVRFSWLISRNATGIAGSLNFLICFSCISEQIDFAWNTEICKSISVSDGIDNSEAIEEEYLDILEQWKRSIPEWAKENNPDKSLKLEGMAADAKAVGDELAKKANTEDVEHVIVNGMTFSKVLSLYSKGVPIFYEHRVYSEILIDPNGKPIFKYRYIYLLPLTHIDYQDYHIQGFVFNSIVSGNLCITAKIYDGNRWEESSYRVCLANNPVFTNSISMDRVKDSAVGKQSVALGRDVSAEADCSATFGWGNRSTGGVSFTCGQNCITDTGAYAGYAEGDGCIATRYAQHVQGKYNIADTENKYSHIVGNGIGNNNRSNAHTLDWEGNAWYQGSVTSNGADYAEFFEWLDGNPNNEDRIGLLVTLDGEKIKKANVGDEIFGIISGTAAVLGDNYECEWNGKYMTDDFGRIVYDNVEEFIDVPTGINEETGETIVEKKSIGCFRHPRINPNYNTEQKYVNRADRPEWATVGMFGKLYLRDDGTSVVNGYATVGENGIATASKEKTNIRVLSRVNDNIIKVLLK